MSFDEIYEQMERDEENPVDMKEYRAAGAAAALSAAATGAHFDLVLREFAQAKYGHLDFFKHIGDRKDLVADALVDVQYVSPYPEDIEGYSALIDCLQAFCLANDIDFSGCQSTARIHLDAEFKPEPQGFVP